MSEKLIYYAERLSIFLVMLALIVGIVGCWGAPPPTEAHTPIWNWYDLDKIRDNLGGSYILMTDLDSSTNGYKELASRTANNGKGWIPIGTALNPFKGHFDGQNHKVCDLFINRPDQNHVGLFGYSQGTITKISMVNVAVSGKEFVSGLVGRNDGIVRNSSSSGSVTGVRVVGGLVGWNSFGQVTSNSHSTCSVTGTDNVGGLVGWNEGTVSNSYSNGSVTGNDYVGGLVGCNHLPRGIVLNSYSNGSVTGNNYVGGLVGDNDAGKVSNSYSTGSVNGKKVVGGLVGWNAHGDVSDSYSAGGVTGEGLVGGLVGRNSGGTVGNSFWDKETSGMDMSEGGTGKTTAEMKDLATFSGAGWKIVRVDPGQTDPSKTWNIVIGQTYPFLSWQPIV